LVPFTAKQKETVVLYRPAATAQQSQIATIRVELIGSDTAVARSLGLTTCSATPVIDLCRKMVAAGHDPAMRLVVYRGGTLALTVRGIGEAACLVINGKGSGFAVRTAPPVREIASGLPLAPSEDAPGGSVT
jgi:hypothetical protein